MGNIPKVIHYCWFGGKPLPRSAKTYIETWKRCFPEYEIKEWNESNFDVNVIPYTEAAYKAGKYAFVSDYARFWIIHKFGGVYFDTDVEAVRPMDDIIEKGAFMGLERKVQIETTRFGVAPGLGIGAEQGNPVFGEILDLYNSLEYGEENNGRMKNVVDILTGYFIGKGWKDEDVIQVCDGITIYPTDYFCPRKERDKSEYTLTENTRTIHHYAGTWLPKSVRIKNRIGDAIGPEALNFLVKLKKLIKR